MPDAIAVGVRGGWASVATRCWLAWGVSPMSRRGTFRSFPSGAERERLNILIEVYHQSAPQVEDTEEHPGERINLMLLYVPRNPQ
jgi:hypothetical protein